MEAAAHDAAQLQELARVLRAQAASELSIARVLIGVSSGVSLAAALAMVLCFVAFQESRRCGRRLLFCLYLADAGAACAWLLVFLLPYDEEAPANGTAGGDILSDTEVSSSLVSTTSTPPLCYAQAYLLLFFMLASCLWTACFAFHLFQILGRQGKTMSELYESRYHLVAWGVPLLTVVHLGLQHALGYDLVGESGLPWCWVRTWSDFEWATSGVYIQLSVFYIPLLLILLHNLTTYLSLLYKMVRHGRHEAESVVSLLLLALTGNLDVMVAAKRRDLQQDGVTDLRSHGRV